MELLKVIREKLGMSQAEMAARLGMKRSGYANYEQGSREFPLSRVPKLKQVSGMSWQAIGKWLEKLYPAGKG